MNSLVLLLLCLIFSTNAQTNLIKNGDFQTVVAPFNDSWWTNSCPPKWGCSGIQHIGKQFIPIVLFSRFLDLWDNVGNGSLYQTVNITQNSNCKLEYYLASHVRTGYHSTCILQVWFNDKLQDTKRTPEDIANLSGNYESLNVSAVAGINTLKFTEAATNIGINCIGSLIDNVSLTCNKLPSNVRKEQFEVSKSSSCLTDLSSKILTSIVSFSIPSIIKILHQPFFILTDLWIYSYNSQNYTGLLLVVFDTIMEVEKLKFEIISKLIGIYDIKPALPLSNYTNFTNIRFYEKEQASFVFIDCQLSFIIFNIPQKITEFTFFYLIHLILKKKSLGKKISKFKYLKLNVLHAIFDENLPYFVFVCFNNFRIMFSFKLFDRFAASVTVIFLFILLMFSLMFFLLVHRYVTNKKHFYQEEFRDCFTSGIFSTLKWPIRSFLRGVIFFAFNQLYWVQVSMLALLEFITILVTIILQRKTRIFKHTASYTLTILCHLSHLSLNVIFLVVSICESISSEYAKKAIKIQQVILCMMAAIILMKFISEILVSHNENVAQNVVASNTIVESQNKQKQKKQQQLLERQAQRKTFSTKTKKRKYILTKNPQKKRQKINVQKINNRNKNSKSRIGINKRVIEREKTIVEAIEEI